MDQKFNFMPNTVIWAISAIMILIIGFAVWFVFFKKEKPLTIKFKTLQKLQQLGDSLIVAKDHMNGLPFSSTGLSDELSREILERQIILVSNLIEVIKNHWNDYVKYEEPEWLDIIIYVNTNSSVEESNLLYSTLAHELKKEKEKVKSGRIETKAIGHGMERVVTRDNMDEIIQNPVYQRNNQNWDHLPDHIKQAVEETLANQEQQRKRTNEVYKDKMPAPNEYPDFHESNPR
jgi:hypothetical protein